ncbi:hypothetical protein JOEDIRT_65 [Mycobacterium phage JoeDirt]|uniref:Uncharacterized protein n=1 Tax=Mycobacterium phage JoeDirt TaxID=2920882 RepID=G1BQJ4_9CAUD|nr:hypothetical protein FGG55_gp065 [Mycobacterium phage JoeDirt]AEK07164.1 hypothetical protein JOEDIRT_65 [Mycobacterium phage JoeDirt]
MREQIGSANGAAVMVRCSAFITDLSGRMAGYGLRITAS